MISVADSLSRDGFVAIHYPQHVRDSASKLVEKWKEYCRLSPNEKGKLVYFKGSGYEGPRSAGRRDRKENFDLQLDGFYRLETCAITSAAPACATELIEQGKSLILDVISPIASKFAGKLEQLYGMRGLEAEVLKGIRAWRLRLLHYPDTVPDVEIAGQHNDKGGFTLHAHESGPGLQYLDWNRDWRDVGFTENQTVVFPGMQLQRRSSNIIKALCHRVVGKAECSGERYSAVCFIVLPDTPAYDKTRLGPSQDHEAGYNYNLTLEELLKFYDDYVVTAGV